MRPICLLVGFLLLLVAPARAGHTPPQVFLRIYVQTTGEGLSAQQASTVTLPPNGETIQIRTLPEITERELIDVKADASGAVHLRFNHQGQVALNAVTSQNENRILVVMLNGYVVYAPTIDEQIDDGELILPHPLPSQAVQLLQDIARKNVQQASRA